MMLAYLLILSVVSSKGPGTIEERVLENVYKGVGVKDSLLFDPEIGILFELKSFEDLTDTFGITPIPEYLLRQFDDVSLNSWKSLVLQNLSKKSEEQTSQGLIPDIDIPLAFPKGLGFIGRGGKLKIDGHQDISFGGRTSYYTDQLSSEFGAPSKFPQLEMDQKLAVRLTGTVGQKIKVNIDHDSERENQLKNKVSLRYEGDEDEVMQLIEAGDTKLSLPSTYFTGFSGGGRKGLFGLRTELKLAGLNVTAIATREQGEASSETVTPTGQGDSLQLYAYQYEKNEYFYVGESDSIVNLVVFVDDGNPDNDSAMGAIPGEALYYPYASATPDSTFPGNVSMGHFNWLRENDDYIVIRGYTLGNTVGRYTLIGLLSPLSDEEELGVYYETSSGKVVGSIQDSSFIHLKLLRPKYNSMPRAFNPKTQDPDSLKWLDLWDLMAKNIYNLQTKNPNSIDIQIYKETSGVPQDGENGKTYLEILKLDLNPKDGKVDPARYEVDTLNGISIYRRLIFENQGLLMFPDPYPFATSDLEEPDSAIYWKRILDNGDMRGYYLKISYTQRSDVITLRPNIIEGSEVIKYHGANLVKNKDYRIDYETGTLTILNPDVLADPNADLQISYDYAPFLSLKQKSLLGTRLDYTISDKIKFGSTFLLRSESSLSDRPRLGEEPIRTALGEFDFHVESDLPFLTRFVNHIPLLRTDKISHVLMEGEMARSFPNPNTLGEAYLDDMEGIENLVRVPVLTRTAWIYGSIPLDTTGTPLDTSNLAVETYWATPVDMVKAGDIYPNLPKVDAEDNTTVFFWTFVPNHPDETGNWVSLNALLSKLGSDLYHMDYIELRVKGKGAKLHIDLGYNISEDIIWRNKGKKILGYNDNVIHDEDVNKNGQLDLNEDTGLDLVAGDDSKWTEGAGDAGNDDYHYSETNKHDFSKINGTENNRRLDTEDLDNDGVLNLSNDYYEYTIDLDDTVGFPPVETTEKGWRYYRIPLKDPNFYKTFGNPSWDNVKYVRLWMDGFTRTDTIMIASLDITGTKWYNYGVFTSDTTLPVDSLTEGFRVGMVNNKEHPYYSPPPGIRIKTDVRGVKEREQSIALNFNDLGKDHFGVAHREIFESQDILDYQEIKFYARAKDNLSAPVTVFLRMGTDTNNFYEYRIKVKSTDWQQIMIPIDSLTQFKKRVQEDSLFDYYSLYVEFPYGVKGSPNLGKINIYELGVLNDSSDSPASGEIWVDDITVTNPRRKGGLAYRGKFSFSLADIGSFSADFTTVGANFQKLTDTQRGRGEKDDYSLSSTLNLDKFTPKGWGLNMPITYRRSQSVSYPKYLTGTDIILTPAQKFANRTFTFSENIDLSYKKSGSKFFLLRWFFDPFSLHANKRRSENFGPTEDTRGNLLSSSLNYNFSPKISSPLKILGQSFYYLPSSYSFGIDYTEDSSSNYSKTSNAFTVSVKRTADASASFSYSPFRPIRFSYNQNRSYDLTYGRQLSPKHETGRREQASFNFNPSFFGIFSPNMSYSASYNESRPEHDTTGVRDAQQNSSLNLNLALGIPKVFHWVGSLKKERPDTVSGPQGPLDPILDLFKILSRVIQAPSLTYRFSRNASLMALLGTPIWQYRWGFALNPNVESLDNSLNTHDITQTYDLSGNLEFGIVSFRYGGSISSQKAFSTGRSTINRALTWPNLEASMSNLQKLLPFLKNFLASSSIRFPYQKKLTESRDIGQENPNSKNSDISINPSLNAQLKMGLGLDASLNYDNQKSQKFGLEASTEDTKTKGLSLSLNYSFKNPKGFKIPILGKSVLRIRSEVQTSLKYSYSATRDIMSGLVNRDEASSAFSLNLSYNFSRSVTGGFNTDYKTTHYKNQGRTYKDIGVTFNVSFKF